MSWFSHAFKNIGRALGVVAPKQPKIIDPGPVPTINDKAVMKAAEDQRRKAAKAVGRAQTILTLGNDALDPANVNRPQIL